MFRASRWLRQATSRASSIKSPTRRAARVSPRTTSGSGATRSVHCGGTAHTVCSSIASNSLFPDALHRSPAHTSGRPRWGWKGCVISTRRVAGTEAPAFCVAAQAALPGSVSLVADGGDAGDAARGASVAAPDRGRRSAGHRCRPSVAAPGEGLTGTTRRNLRSSARLATLPRRGHAADVSRPPDHPRRSGVSAHRARDAAAPQPARPVVRRLRRLAVAATERAAV
jgi:hypothetical protein